MVKRLNIRKIKMVCIVATFIALFSLSAFAVQPQGAQAIEPFFTLVAKTGDSVGADYLNFVSQHLGRIGINVDVQVLDWPTFVAELVAFRDFDIFNVGFRGGGVDPDWSGVYDENGSLNAFGYHTSYDYNETLGTGLNEWYIKEGNLIMPPDSEDRVNHYWAWEQYMMDKVCLMKPLFSPRAFVVQWANLIGYNYSDGIKDSWGKLYWDGSHRGQSSTDELVTSDVAWSDFNPLFSDDAASHNIYGMTLDELIVYDSELKTWPHLATDWYHINATHLRIELREDVKWQSDPDGLFPNEYFDAKDVYFTYYAWKYLSNDQHTYNWIDDMKIVDDYTFDLYIDGDPDTPENEPYAPYIASLNTYMLPEHYLNQTQTSDGVTPDITHSSWNKYSTNVFGTGILELSSFVEGVETFLEVFDDAWIKDPALASDPDLDWENRFGTEWQLTTWRQRIIPDVQTALLEFEAGKTDIEGCTTQPQKRDNYAASDDFMVQDDTQYFFSFIGYNMREVRPYIGSLETAPGDSTLTVGLAIRKAISYAIDRQEINNVEHRGEYTITDFPIHLKMGIWCNPNIIRYNHDIDKAREYMEIAGFSVETETTSTPGFGVFIGLSSLFVVSVAAVYITKKKK